MGENVQLQVTAMNVRKQMIESVDVIAKDMLDGDDFNQLERHQQQAYRDTVIQAYNLLFDVRS